MTQSMTSFSFFPLSLFPFISYTQSLFSLFRYLLSMAFFVSFSFVFPPFITFSSSFFLFIHFLFVIFLLNFYHFLSNILLSSSFLHFLFPSFCSTFALSSNSICHCHHFSTSAPQSTNEVSTNIKQSRYIHLMSNFLSIHFHTKGLQVHMFDIVDTLFSYGRGLIVC